MLVRIIEQMKLWHLFESESRLLHKVTFHKIEHWLYALNIFRFPEPPPGAYRTKIMFSSYCSVNPNLGYSWASIEGDIESKIDCLFVAQSPLHMHIKKHFS